MVFIRRLHWNPGSVAHIARHGVRIEEVEQVCQGNPVVRQSYEGRLIFIGPSADNRMLAVILDPEGDAVYYSLTARPASRRERRQYRREQRGESP